MAVSLSEIQTRFGGSNPISMNEYYSGGSYVTPSYTYSNYTAGLGGYYAGTVPRSGKISMADLTTTAAPITYTRANTPLKTAYGQNTTSWYNLTNILPSNKLNTGDKIFICSYNTGNWMRYPYSTTEITIGTPKVYTTPNPGGKVYFGQISYDGKTSIRLKGYYSGPSTKFPNGQISLQGVGPTT